MNELHPRPAMARSDHVLLFWLHLPGFCLPSLFFVSLLLTVCRHSLTACSSMRYSRMLEESSFANRRADYFWLLLLSSVMLLVSYTYLLSC